LYFTIYPDKKTERVQTKRWKSSVLFLFCLISEPYLSSSAEY
ncbi:hypothetical protein HMPREF1557_00649, partial [Streptococcus sobrinus W1703]